MFSFAHEGVKISLYRCYTAIMININKILLKPCNNRKILEWSSGEVLTSETINYRTMKPVPGGLFCQRIFGPVNDYSCDCANYKSSNYLNGICKICGVVINKKRLRRTNMGHIKLEIPLVHPWYFKLQPSRLSMFLNIEANLLRRVIYYEKYMVVYSMVYNIKIGKLIDEKELNDLIIEYGDNIVVKIGADAISFLINKVDVAKEYKRLKLLILRNPKLRNKKNFFEKFNMFRSFYKNNTPLDSFILNFIPVLPPDLRPIVRTGDKVVSSDLNDLYKKIIDRNFRLKKILKIGAPNFIIRSEKRLLQNSFDCLIENGKSEKIFRGSSKNLLKSLSDCLKGKRGIFRQNLLGKRVDYSARSVISVEPRMKISQCGIPFDIAVEIFRPFIYYFLISNGISENASSAKEEVDYKTRYCKRALKKLIKERRVILNRAPTLHRLNIRSFKAYIVDDHSIHIHPLVCSAFNADFDGDQMAVHIPLSKEAVIETEDLLSSENNIFLPSNGKISIMPTQDIVLGIFYMTLPCDCFSKRLFFCDVNSAINFYNANDYKNRNIIFMIEKGKYINTTLRRLYLYKILPVKYLFIKYNKVLDRKDLYSLIEEIKNLVSKKSLISFIQKISSIGFKFATISGITISVSDIVIPKKRFSIINKYFRYYNFIELHSKKQKEKSIKFSFKRSSKVLWDNLVERLNFITIENLNKRKFSNFNRPEKFVYRNNNLSYILRSGARGSDNQVIQLSGCRGHVVRSGGKVIKTPIISNLRMGLDVMQYFLSAFGARKGLSDTSLKTADSGYLTRRLVDSSQDMVINKIDCKTTKFLRVFIDKKNYKDYLGYYVFRDVYVNKKLVLRSNSMLDRSNINYITSTGGKYLFLRTPVCCCLKRGICSYCYGSDIISEKRVNLGSAVGFTAAQSIGEPGTQLTMRTFHTGGFIHNTAVEIKDHIINSCFFTLEHSILYTYNKTDNRISLLNKGRLYFMDFNGNTLTSKSINAGDSLPFKNFYSPLMISKKIVSTKENFIPIKIDGIRNIKTNTRNIKYVREGNGISFYSKSVGTLSFELKGRRSFFILLPKFKYYLNKKAYGFFVFSSSYKRVFKSHGDITDALKRVSRIFEARKGSSNSCYRSPAHGVLYRLGNNYFCLKNKNKKLITIKGIIDPLNNIDSLVLKGSKLIYGSTDLCSLISLLGLEFSTNYFRNKIYNIYSKYGVDINKKHIEVIFTRMISRVFVVCGSEKFMLKEFYYNRNEIEKINISSRNKLTYLNNVMGITKLSLLSDSFLSSASFQESSKVLFNSVIHSRQDLLLGIKENIILGRLIPAGTGFIYHLFLNKKNANDKSINKEK